MDIFQIALIVGEVIVSGLVIFKAIDLAKLSSSLPWFTKERTDLIRGVNLALSALSIALIAFANHALGFAEIQNLVQAVVGVAAVWATAHAAHGVMKPAKDQV